MRTFVGLALTSASRAALFETSTALVSAKPPQIHASFAVADNMHITLKFLGDVDVDAVAKPTFEAARALAPRMPLDLSDGKLAAFPDTRSARVVIVEVAANAIAGMAAACEEAAEHHGIARENRPFRAHATLARLKSAANVEKWLARATAPRVLTAEALVLYESRREGQGVRYVPLLTFTW